MMSVRLLRNSFIRLRCCHASVLARSSQISCQQFPIHTGQNFRTFIQSQSHIFHFSSLATETESENKSTAAISGDRNIDKEQDILETLRVEGQSKSRVHPYLIEEYLRTIKNDKLTNEDLSLLLTCCGSYLPHVPKKQQQKLLNEIWAKRSETIDAGAKITYLQACRGLKVAVDATKFQQDAVNDTKLLEAIFYTLAEQGDLVQITSMSANLQSKEVTLTEPMLAALIRANSISNHPENIKAVLDTMSALNMEQSAVTIFELVENHIRRGEVKEATQLINEKGTLLSTDMLLKIVETSFDCGLQKEFVINVLKILPKDVVNDREIDTGIKNLCSRLIQKTKFEEVRSIISFLPAPKFQANEDTDTFAYFILQELVSLPAPLDEILATTNQLIEEEKNERALHAVTGAAQKQNLNLFMELLPHLKEKEPLRPHYFWPNLIQAGEVRNESEIVNVIRRMSYLGVEIDTETFTFYVLPKLVLTLKNVERGVKHLEEAGVKTSVLMTPLLVHLLFQQRLREALLINETYKAKINGEPLVHPLVTAFSLNRTSRDFAPVMAKLVRSIYDKTMDPKYDFVGHVLVELISNPKTKSDLGNIKQLLNELCIQQVKISSMAADMTLQHIASLISDDEHKDYMKSLVNRKIHLPATGLIQGRIKPPNEMNIEELERHLEELKSKNMNTRGVLRRLLQKLVREGKYDRALEVKAECDRLKVDISPGMQASIFDLYTHKKDIPKAKEALRKLNQNSPSFLLDEYKIIDYAAVLVEKGDLDDARKVLRVRAGTVEVRGGENLSMNVWNLLNAVATISPTLDQNVANHTFDFFLFLKKFNYCGYTNTALGPIIKEHLNRLNLKGAVQQYIEFTKSQRLTPLQKQLIAILVDVMNRPEEQEKFGVTLEQSQQMLRDVLAASTSVHGPASTNAQLIVALAEAGTEKQLRKVLIDPKVRISPDYLRKQLEFLNSAKKLDALLKLARCSRGLNYIREQDIYDMVMTSLSHENDYEKALALFERLSADDELKLSNEFVRNLIDLLKRNNLEPPTSVALYAK